DGMAYVAAPPFILTGPMGGFYPPVPQPAPVVFVGPMPGGLMLPQPRNQQGARPPDAAAAQRQAPKPDPGKADGLVTIGDRMFRVGNYRRAEDRYDQASRANPNSAVPHVRLAQLALVRGDYQEAAEEFRSAITAEPAWLSKAGDIQAVYAEPADFAKVLARL